MKHAILALGLGLGLGVASFVAAPVLAQQGGHIVKRVQPSASAQKDAKPQVQPKPRYGYDPGPADDPLRSAVGGQERQGQPQGFNTERKPLGGPGYRPEQFGR